MGSKLYRWLLCAVASATLFTGSIAYSQGTDPLAGLIRAENWQLVVAHCSACHSLSIVTGQRGSRDRWLSMIRWMQETQNLWQFEPETEEKLLDYLAENYGAPEWPSRRPPLPAHLLPEPRSPGGPRS